MRAATCRWAGGALAAVALSSMVSRPLAAQAICSAPHSSPVLASGGTIRTLRPGTGWVQVSAFRQSSDEFFNPNSQTQPFLAGGEVRTSSLYLTGAVGVVPGLDAWVQLPLHHIRYADQGGKRERTGTGDPRVSVRVSPELVGLPGVPLALRAGVKFPGSGFPEDATIVALGEGQRDVEVSVETGKAFSGVPVYVMGWIGYRWRTLNAEAEREPGDERFAHAAVGGTLSSFHVELAAEFMSGLTPRQQDLELPSARRRLVQLTPTVGYQLGRGAIEFTALVPLAGRNLPSGPGASVGYRFAWGGP